MKTITKKHLLFLKKNIEKEAAEYGINAYFSGKIEFDEDMDENSQYCIDSGNVKNIEIKDTLMTVFYDDEIIVQLIPNEIDTTIQFSLFEGYLIMLNNLISDLK